MGEDAKKRIKEEQKRYIEGLKHYQEKGIPIYIDGELAVDDLWNKIFEVREDGSFYMGDYVGADEGKLTEIRFDKVYYN